MNQSTLLSPGDSKWLHSPPECRHIVSVERPFFGRLLRSIAEGLNNDKPEANLMLGCGLQVIDTLIAMNDKGFFVKVRGPDENWDAPCPFSLDELKECDFEYFIGREATDYKNVSDSMPMLVAACCEEVPLDESIRAQLTPSPASDGQVLQSRLMMAVQYGLTHEVAEVARIAVTNRQTGKKAVDLLLALDLDRSSGFLNAIRDGRAELACEAVAEFCLATRVDRDGLFDLMTHVHGDRERIFASVIESAIDSRDAGPVRALSRMCEALGMTSRQVERLLLLPDADGKPPLYRAYETEAHWVMTALRDICSGFDITDKRALQVFVARGTSGNLGIRLIAENKKDPVVNALKNAFEKLKIDMHALKDSIHLSAEDWNWLHSPPACRHIVSAEAPFFGHLLGTIAEELGSSKPVATLVLGCGFHVINASIETSDQGLSVSVRGPGVDWGDVVPRHFSLDELKECGFTDVVGELTNYKSVGDSMPMMVAVCCPEVPLGKMALTPPSPASAKEILQARLMMAVQYGLTHEVAEVAQIAVVNGQAGKKAVDLLLALDLEGSPGFLNAIRNGRGEIACAAVEQFCLVTRPDPEGVLELMTGFHGHHNDQVLAAAVETAILRSDARLVLALGRICRRAGMSSEHVERMLLHPNADGKPPLYCAYEKDAHWVIAAVRDICFTFNIRGERAQNVFLARNAKEEPGVGLTGQSNVEEVPKALAQAYERLGIDPKDVETAVNA